jgi:hypothetical protein
VVLSLLACASHEAGDTSGPTFVVVGVNPEDRAVDVVESAAPQLHFSGDLDLASCAPDAFRLDGIDSAFAVAFAVPVVWTSIEAGAKLALDPDGPLPRGWHYAVTVRGGACTSLDGVPLAPFSSSFLVP